MACPVINPNCAETSLTRAVEIGFAAKVVVDRATCDAGGLSDVFEAGGVVAFATEDGEGGVEQVLASLGGFFLCAFRHGLHTNMYV